VSGSCPAHGLQEEHEERREGTTMTPLTPSTANSCFFRRRSITSSPTPLLASGLYSTRTRPMQAKGGALHEAHR
jgi:hypothetical protein